MRKTYLFALFTVVTCALTACKKDALTAKEQNSKLIVGTWKTSQQNIKVYDINTEALLKDSTIVFDTENASRSWSEIFDDNGHAYSTTTSVKTGASFASTDTTNYATYSIVGTNLIVKQNIGGSQTKPILTLTVKDMGLQYSYAGTLNAGWGLGTGNTYKIVQATYYVKQ